MKVVIFGASGKTGRHLVAQALAEGHEVRAFVRDPSKLGLQHERLRVIEGDVLDRVAVEQAVAGDVNAVLSALGHTKTSTKDVQTVGTGNIVGGMKKNEHLRRLVSLTGAGVREPDDQPKLADRGFALLLRLVAPSVLADAERHAEVIKESGLDWVIVRAPRLTNGPWTGEYRASNNVDRESGVQVSHADVADFMLGQLTDDTYVRRSPMVSA